MAINRFQGNFRNSQNIFNNNVGQQGIRRTGRVENTPKLPSSGKVVNYDSILNQIYDKGGIQGLLDYLNTLDKGVLSNLNSVKDGGTWTLSFAINGKIYTYVENKSSNTQSAPAATSPDLTQTDDYDSTLNKIANESGIEGLQEYLNSLKDGQVTFMHRCNTPENYYPKREYLVFTLNGENYTFCATTSQKGPNSPETTETAKITDRSRIPYEFIVNDLYEKGDIQGLVEYLDTLDSGVLTFYYPQKTTDGKVHYVFTLNGHGYNFEVENWPEESVDSSKEESYTVTLNKIFCESGVQGILEYLNTLEDGVLTSLRVNPWVDAEHNIGHWGISFSIGDKTYTFSEAGDAWDDTFIDKYVSYNKWSDTVTSAGQVDEYDLKGYEDKVYILGGADEEANIEQLKNDIEKCDIKGQMKEKFMKQIRHILRLDIEIDDSVKRPIIGEETAELMFELDYNNILESVLNDLTPSYTTNENGEQVPCVKFEDVIQRLIANFQMKMNGKMDNGSDNGSTLPYVNGQEMYNAKPVKYKKQSFEVNNDQDFEYKREKMKKFMMDLKVQYAKSYGISSDNKKFAALFEESVDAALEFIKTTPNIMGGISGLNYSFREVTSDMLVRFLNMQLGNRIDYNILKQLKSSGNEQNQNGTKNQQWTQNQQTNNGRTDRFQSWLLQQENTQFRRIR